MFGHLYSKQQTTEPRGAPFAAGVITTRCRDKAKAKAGLRSDPAGIFFSANLEIVVQINSGQALVHSVRSFAGYRRIPVSGTIDWLRFRSPIPCARAALAPPIRSGFGRDCDSMMDEH